MAKTIPMIVTNENILVWDMENEEFKPFNMPAINNLPNIPFYHQFAEKIAEGQYYFKEFMKGIYGKKLSKYIFAIIVPDDTTKLESIFINEFFVNSGACKAVAQMPMALALSKNDDNYISVSKSSRNVVLQYVRNHETVVSKMYDATSCNPAKIAEDSKILHIDLEYRDVPVYVNNFNMNMDEFFSMGKVISPKEFMEKISVIDVEKL
ncbi:MAG: hypothetical protein PUE08_08685 [Eubacteriales bacterium]|nr:hypothetical protein [Eubacteriales bacterium]